MGLATADGWSAGGDVPQWGPQQPWGPPPGPPPRGGKGKWIFGGIALLAVIAVTVVITVLVVGKDSGSGDVADADERQRLGLRECE